MDFYLGFESVILVILLFTTQSRLLTTLKKKASENTVEKGENAGDLFPQCFLDLSKTEIVILAKFNLLSANAFNLVTSKILLFGKGSTG